MKAIGCSARPCVFLAEDDQALAVMIQYNLEKVGFRVATASDGDAALAQMSAACPDFIVLDWMLPRVSGLDLCRKLRSQAATRHLPVVMITARGDPSDLMRCLEAGADHYLLKPFAVSELIGLVAARLGSANLRSAPTAAAAPPRTNAR